MNEPKPMFWSSALEYEELKLEKLTLRNIGDYVLPVPYHNVQDLIARASSGELKNFQFGLDSNIVNVDASFVALGEAGEKEQAFFESVSDLSVTALKKATNINFDFLNLNLKVNFKKALICLPGLSYKSYTKPAVVESGFAGTILIQIPVQNGIEGTSLNVVYQNEQVAQLDLTKNSNVHSHLALLLNPTTSSPLHFEITAPTSGALVMLVFHLVWADSSKLTTKLSTLPAFFNFSSNLKSSITKAETRHDEANIDTSSATGAWSHRVYYLPLPRCNPSLASSSSDTLFALSSLKEFDIVGVDIETVARDSNGNANTITIRKILNPSSCRLTPTKWIGNPLQVAQVSFSETNDVLVDSKEEFGILIVPRREFLFRSCSDDMHHVIETIRDRFSSLNTSTAWEICSSASQLIYDLQVVADFIGGKHCNFETREAASDLRTLLDTCLHLKLNDTVASVLRSIEAQVLPTPDQLQGNVTSMEAGSASKKDLTELVQHYRSKTGGRDMANRVKRAGDSCDVNQLILDTLSSHSRSFNVKMHRVSVEEIDQLIDSLSSISVDPSASKSPAVLSKIGDFFLRFGSEQLIKVFVNYQERHPGIHESFPDLYSELFKRIAHLKFDSCIKNQELLRELADVYAKSGSITDFPRVFAHTSLTKEITKRRIDMFNDFLVSRIKSWSSLKTFYNAFKATNGGQNLLQRLFQKVIETLKAKWNKKSAKPESRHGKKQPKPGPLSVSRGAFPKLIRYAALELLDRSGSKVTPSIPPKIQHLFDLFGENDRGHLFRELVKWDEAGLKSDDDVLILMTDMFYAFLRRSTKLAPGISEPAAWSKMADCFAWRANVPLIDNFVSEVIARARDQKKRDRIQGGGSIFKGILQSSLGFGSKEFAVKKPTLKEKFIDEILDLWIAEIDRLERTPNPPPNLRKKIVFCITAFFRARKFNLFMPKSLAHVQLLHKIAKTFCLVNFVEMFEEILTIEVDPVRPVSKTVDSVSWRLYVSMCSWAVSSQELEGFLVSCNARQAEMLYGFALWCGNKHMLDKLNEKIIAVTDRDSACGLRQSLANLPSLKRLAVDACSKEALAHLSDIQPVAGGDAEEKAVKEHSPGQPEASSQPAISSAQCDEPPVKKIKVESDI